MLKPPFSFFHRASDIVYRPSLQHRKLVKKQSSSHLYYFDSPRMQILTYSICSRPHPPDPAQQSITWGPLLQHLRLDLEPLLPQTIYIRLPKRRRREKPTAEFLSRHVVLQQRECRLGEEYARHCKISAFSAFLAPLQGGERTRENLHLYNPPLNSACA